METILAVGIDLAVQHLDTGICVLRRTDNGGCVADFDRRHRGDEGIAWLIAEAAAAEATVAIDVPLGWPEPFTKFLQDPTSPASLGALNVRTSGYRFETLRLRQADIALWKHLGPAGAGSEPGRRASRPLSVSTDKLGAATMRWHAIASSIRRRDGAEAVEHVIETYPAAARYLWQWRATERDAPELGLIGLRRIPHNRDEGTPCNHEDVNAHEWDALVAALVAALSPEHRQTFPANADLAPPGEGVIHVPRPGAPLAVASG